MKVDIKAEAFKLYIRGARYILWDFEHGVPFAVNRIPIGTKLVEHRTKEGTKIWDFTETVISFDCNIMLSSYLKNEEDIFRIDSIFPEVPTTGVGYAVACISDFQPEWEFSPIFSHPHVAKVHSNMLGGKFVTRIVKAEVKYTILEEGDTELE